MGGAMITTTTIIAPTVATTLGQDITISISPLAARQTETPCSWLPKTPNAKNRRYISASVEGEEDLDCMCV